MEEAAGLEAPRVGASPWPPKPPQAVIMTKPPKAAIMTKPPKAAIMRRQQAAIMTRRDINGQDQRGILEWSGAFRRMMK